MALPAEDYILAALEAELHAQVEVDRVVLPASTPGEAVVEGRVARVFRGEPELVSSRISFEVSCMREGDNPPPSGVIWKDADDVARAVVVEAYLDRSEEGYHVALWQSFLLDSVTDTPQALITEADLRAARERMRQPMSWGPISVLELLRGAVYLVPIVLFFGVGLLGIGMLIMVLWNWLVG